MVIIKCSNYCLKRAAVLPFRRSILSRLCNSVLLSIICLCQCIILAFLHIRVMCVYASYDYPFICTYHKVNGHSSCYAVCACYDCLLSGIV
jgi:hypothetical protein